MCQDVVKVRFYSGTHLWARQGHMKADCEYLAAGPEAHRRWHDCLNA